MTLVSDPVRIGILGDFNPDYRSHHATNECLQHAAHKLNLEIQSEWLPTPSLIQPSAPNIVIYPVACAVPSRAPDRPKLSGVVPEIRLRPGSYLAGYYGKEVVE